MRLKIYLLIISCFISVKLWAQTPKTIEADLLKSFKKINYLHDKNDDDGVVKANEEFAKKLMMYATRYPATINQNFTLLKKEHLNISTSEDGLFRIYSWDDETGGTERYFRNIFQYKLKDKINAVLDSVKQEGDSMPFYNKLYTLKANSNTFYLVTYLFIGSSRYYGAGVQCFSVTHEKLDNDVKIIKTASGLHSQISYEIDLGTVNNEETMPSINFDATTNKLNIPLVTSKGKPTNRYITYKFTGQCFEKIK